MMALRRLSSSPSGLGLRPLDPSSWRRAFSSESDPASPSRRRSLSPPTNASRHPAWWRPFPLILQERDPIERVRKLVLADDIATVAELKDIGKEIRKQVDDAIAEAKESPMPDPSELFTNVYAKGLGTEPNQARL